MESQKTLDNAPQSYVANNIIAEYVDKAANMESAKLSTIFPNEIWLQILETVFDPKDLQHLHQSSQFFRSLFQDIKTKALFPEVIRIFSAKLYSAHKHTWDILLKCRPVCRTWQLAVDSVFHSFFEYCSLLDRSEQINEYVPNMASTEIKLFVHDHYATRFLSHFDDKYAASNRNPFLCKSVRMYYSLNIMDVQMFTPQALKTFRIYGHHISRFCLTYDIPYETHHLKPLSVVSIFEQLPEFLNRMTNLKALELRCNMDSHIVSSDLEDLELSMKSIAFPILNKMQHLSLRDFPTPVFDAVLRNYSHVTMLSLPNTSVTSSHLSLYVQPLPNLTQLELAVENNSTLTLLEISNVKWPLTTLLLKVNTAVFDWEKLFQIMENCWADTLTELKIETYCFWKRPPYILPSLHLPNLKAFVLDSKQVVPLDFILPMANTLERLVVNYNTVAQIESELQNEQVVKFYMFRKNLMNSNIWALFPKLKYVEYYGLEVGFSPSPNRPPLRRQNQRKLHSKNIPAV